jgi:hypothetical protein
MMWTGIIQPITESIARFLEHGNESAGCMNGRKHLDQLIDR